MLHSNLRLPYSYGVSSSTYVLPNILITFSGPGKVIDDRARRERNVNVIL
jgi:hypothetical protein